VPSAPGPQARPAPHRSDPGPARLDRAPRPGPPRPEPPVLPGPAHRTGHPPLRTRPPRRAGPRGRQETRPDPDGGGHKVLGRQVGRATRNGLGFDYIHSAVDDHSRLAYSEVHPDEKAATCADFLRRAAAFFTTAGIDSIERVLTDNAWPYRKRFAWRQALADPGAAGKLTRAYQPQTNGKVERFNRTLLDEWAYQRPYTSNTERTDALADFLHTYNHHRCHTALGGKPPVNRVNNAPGQYT
jgi:transposase InsO family protein